MVSIRAGDLAKISCMATRNDLEMTGNDPRNHSKMVQNAPKIARNAPKTHPKSPKTHPKCAQNHSKCTQNVPKITQNAPKITQNAPKMHPKSLEKGYFGCDFARARGQNRGSSFEDTIYLLCKFFLKISLRQKNLRSTRMMVG